MPRLVEPEILDELPCDAREARRSRADLVRVNALMRHAHLIRRAIPDHVTHLVDLGAGDGTLVLKVLERDAGNIQHVTLVDRQRVADETIIGHFRRLDISAAIVVADVFEWLRESAVHRPAMIANLFLHHFKTGPLQELLRLAAERCDVFIACEPRRTPSAAVAASLLGLIGCNRVTRHDARLSVRAGFRGRELSALWPAAGWRVQERQAGLFTHLFIALRA